MVLVKMVIYNETNLTASLDLYQITKSVNELTGGQWAIMIFVAIFFSTYFALSKRASNSVSLVASSFFCSVAGIILFLLGWISTELLGVPLAILALSLIMYFLVRE